MTWWQVLIIVNFIISLSILSALFAAFKKSQELTAKINMIVNRASNSAAGVEKVVNNLVNSTTGLNVVRSFTNLIKKSNRK
jgi:hypothetical protein